jgi:hypothetical protein
LVVFDGPAILLHAVIAVANVEIYVVEFLAVDVQS